GTWPNQGRRTRAIAPSAALPEALQRSAKIEPRRAVGIDWARLRTPWGAIRLTAEFMPDEFDAPRPPSDVVATAVTRGVLADSTAEETTCACAVAIKVWV